MKSIRQLIVFLLATLALILVLNQVFPQADILSGLTDNISSPTPSPSTMIETDNLTGSQNAMASAGEAPAESMVRAQIYLPQAEVITFDQPADEAVSENATALSLLQSASAENNLQLNIDTYDFGSFVSGIDTATASAEFTWLYYINGESAQVGSDQYILKPGDLIEWKYEVLE